MGQNLLLADALRGALLFAAALLAVLILRRAAASTRRLVLVMALAAGIGVPAFSAALPEWRVEAPGLALPLTGTIVGEPAVRGEALAPAAPASPSIPTEAAMDPTSVVAAVWALGVLFFMARVAASSLRARAIARRAGPASAWERARTRAQGATGLRVEVRETSELDSPAVLGVLSPLVLVPRLAVGWDDQRRYHILLHEMAHVRRRDCLAQIVADLAVALHWFNPLAWLCARRLRVERELAADDAVLERGARPSSYAEDLLAVAGVRPAIPGALGMGEPGRLVARVRAVLASGKNRAPLGPVATAATLVFAIFAALAIACATPTDAGGGATTAGGSAPLAATPGEAGSTDPAIQVIAEEELDRTLRDWAAPAGAVLVLDPRTGRILADAGRDRGARADVGRLRAYVPGSTLKIVTVAAALESGLASPADTIDCEHGAFVYAPGKTIHDASSHGVLPLPQVLAVSSNVGMAKLFDRVGGERLTRELRALHFGAPPGSIPDAIEDHSMRGVLSAVGEAESATPLQIAAAYAVLARGGTYVEPTFSARAGATAGEPVMKPETAHALMAMLDEVVNGEEGTGKAARVAGVRVAGKTGTAAWDLPGGGEGRYASFVGIVPEDAPRWVVLVGVEQPKDDAGGGDVAAPAFARVVTRVMSAGR